MSEFRSLQEARRGLVRLYLPIRLSRTVADREFWREAGLTLAQRDAAIDNFVHRGQAFITIEDGVLVAHHAFDRVEVSK